MSLRSGSRFRASLALLRVAAAALETEQHFRTIMGYRDPWMLEAALDEGQSLGDQRQTPIHNGRVAAWHTRESRPT